jgi:hypothetical protein
MESYSQVPTDENSKNSLTNSSILVSKGVVVGYLFITQNKVFCNLMGLSVKSGLQ